MHHNVKTQCHNRRRFSITSSITNLEFAYVHCVTLETITIKMDLLTFFAKRFNCYRVCVLQTRFAHGRRDLRTDAVHALPDARARSPRRRHERVEPRLSPGDRRDGARTAAQLYRHRRGTSAFRATNDVTTTVYNLLQRDLC